MLRSPVPEFSSDPGDLFFVSFFLLLQLEPVCDHGNELGIGGLSLGVGDGVAEIPLSIAAQCLHGIFQSQNLSQNANSLLLSLSLCSRMFIGLIALIIGYLYRIVKPSFSLLPTSL